MGIPRPRARTPALARVPPAGLAPLPPAPPAAAAGAGSWIDTILLAAGALAVLVLLRQRAFHGLDAQQLIRLVQAGDATYYSHKLYLPLVLRWHELLAPWTDSPFLTMRAASMAGVTLGTLAVHRAGLALGLDRTRAALAAALTLAAPAVLFFGTVVEIHGVFHAFVGLALWQWARGVAAPSPARWAVVGLCTGIAAGVHSSGHFLLALLPALVLGRPGRGWRAVVPSLAAMVVVHAAVTLLVANATATGPTPWATTQRDLAAVWAYYRLKVPHTVSAIAHMVWAEWAAPFLPLSLTTVLALAVPRQRRAALALLAGIVPLFGLVWIGTHNELYERGAYLLPFAWPAAVLLVQWAPKAAVAALAFALALSVTQVLQHDRVADDPALSAGVRAVAGTGDAFVLCASFPEVEQLQRDVPAVEGQTILMFDRALASGYAALCAEFDRTIAPPLAAGRTVLVTPGAYQLLLQFADAQRLVREHVAQHYVLEPLAVVDFAGYRLRRR